MSILFGGSEKRSFSARSTARKVLMRAIKDFEPDDDWIEEAIEIGRFDATPSRVARVRDLIEEERRKLSDKLEERWS